MERIPDESKRNEQNEFNSFRIFIYGIYSFFLVIFTIYYIITPSLSNALVSGLFIIYTSSGIILVILIESKRNETTIKTSESEHIQKIQSAFKNIEDKGNKLENYVSEITKINIENLNAYYSLVKLQADRSFLASISCSIFGFLIIISAIIYLLISNNTPNSQQINYITTLAGIITEFISAIFFYLYSQTVRQLKEYHKTLINVQDLLLSIWITKEIQNEDKRNQIISKIIENLSCK